MPCATRDRRTILPLVPALLFLVAPAATALQETATQAKPGLAIAADPAIAVVGASVSAGFRLADYEGSFSNLRARAERTLGRELSDAEYGRRTDSVPPGEVLAAVYGREIATYGDNFLFSDPAGRGRRVLETALQEGAELVIGIDLMFWFGYGRLDRDAAASPMEQRLALQKTGLALLEELLAEHPRATLVLGDYPDMTGAVPAMITPEMIPDASALEALNRGLAEWVEARPRVELFSLSASLERLRSGAATLVLEGEERTVGTAQAFQLAQVHPTRLGTALLVRDLGAFLATVDERLRPEKTGDDVYAAAAGARLE